MLRRFGKVHVQPKTRQRAREDGALGHREQYVSNRLAPVEWFPAVLRRGSASLGVPHADKATPLLYPATGPDRQLARKAASMRSWHRVPSRREAVQPSQPAVSGCVLERLQKVATRSPVVTPRDAPNARYQ